jgi:hypothetical protein
MSGNALYARAWPAKATFGGALGRRVRDKNVMEAETL